MSLQDDARRFAKTLNALNATLKKCADEIDWRTAELYSTEQQLADAMAMINELGFECEQVKKKLAAVTTEHDALKAECILAHNQTATALKVVEAHNYLASIEERDALKKDAERLDFLDRSLSRKFGWKVSVAPAGNVSVTSVIFLGDQQPVSIRTAIDDAAIAATGSKT